MSQKSEIRKHLEAGNSITPLEALGVFNVYRLAARVWEINKDLEEEGSVMRVVANTKRDAHRKPYATYTLIDTSLTEAA